MRSSFVGVALCCFVMAASCNEVAGIKEPVSGEGGSAPAATGIDRFYGTWNAVDGVVTLKNCPEATTLTMQSGQLVLAKGTDIPLVVFSPPCQLAASVDGEIATLTAGQTCTVPGDATKSVPTFDFVYELSTFTLAATDPNRATESITARVTLSNASTGAKVDVCEYEESATFTKL